MLKHLFLHRDAIIVLNLDHERNTSFTEHTTQVVGLKVKMQNAKQTTCSNNTGTT